MPTDDRGKQQFTGSLKRFANRRLGPSISGGLDIANLDGSWTRQLEAYLEACPYPVKIFSAHRSIAHQAQLYARSKGSGFVARPGWSPHNFGFAVDLDIAKGDYTSPKARWLHGNAAAYGLNYRILHSAKAPETWHVEPSTWRVPHTAGITTLSNGRVVRNTDAERRDPTLDSTSIISTYALSDSALASINAVATKDASGQTIKLTAAGKATQLQILNGPQINGIYLYGIMFAQASMESGGGVAGKRDYTIVNSIGAAGAYQFLRTTWNEYTRRSGIGRGYASAHLAPPSVQDAVAAYAYRSVIEFQGARATVERIAAAWFIGQYQKIETLDRYINQNINPTAGTKIANAKVGDYVRRLRLIYNTLVAGGAGTAATYTQPSGTFDDTFEEDNNGDGVIDALDRPVNLGSIGVDIARLQQLLGLPVTAIADKTLLAQLKDALAAGINFDVQINGLTLATFALNAA